MKKLLALIAAIITTSLLLYGLVSLDAGPRHHGLAAAELQPLIPVRDFHASLDAEWDYKISENGEWISWRRASAFGEEVAVAPVAAMSKPAIIREETISSHGFMPDGRFSIVVEGRIWAMPPDDVSGTVRVDVTPRGHRSIRFLYNSPDGSMIVMSNDRNPAFDDVYRHDANGGSRTLVEKNPGDVIHWRVSRYGRLFMRVRVGDDKKRITEIRAGDDENWRPLRSHDVNTMFQPLTTRLADGSLQAISNRGRDKTALVAVRPGNDHERVIAGFEDADTVGAHILSGNPDAPVDIVQAAWGYKKSRALTARGRVFLRLVTGGKDRVDWAVHSRSLTREIFLVNRSIDEASWEYVLVNLHDETAKIFDRFHFGRKHGGKLARTRTVKFRSRDGLEIPALLTLPRTGEDPGPLPAIVRVHGGPATADVWGYDHLTQFLANRGYVVMSVNYRGSTGFGRAFVEAGFGQFGRAMQDDIADGARWLIDQRIADPEAIGVMGSSFGGYGALMAVSRDPGLFKAAIAHSAVSDLVYQQTNNPFAWGLELDRWERYFGSLATVEDRAALEKNAPINLVDRVHAPILITHGKRDTIVGFEQTEAYVRALNDAGKVHTAIYFDREGHGYANWRTNVELMRLTEGFLARHLGGRNGRYDFVELAAKFF